MAMVKVLKRKDAASVVVAVVLGLILERAVTDWAARPSDWLTGSTSAGGGWKAGVWVPLVTLLVQLILLEVVVRLYCGIVGSWDNKK